MKFNCICGEVIRDNTDCQDNKAYLIPDETYESALEQIESGGSPRDTLRNVGRVMYQCHSFARLFIEDQMGKRVCFAPEGNVSFGIFKGMTPDA